MKNRKRRSDRNHLIYRIVNRVTREEYVGLTVIRAGNIEKSMGIRWKGHQYKAFVEMKDTVMCVALRKFGPDAFVMIPMWVIRGKTEAHALERSVVSKRRPIYNILCL